MLKEKGGRERKRKGRESYLRNICITALQFKMGLVWLKVEQNYVPFPRLPKTSKWNTPAAVNLSTWIDPFIVLHYEFGVVLQGRSHSI